MHQELKKIKKYEGKSFVIKKFLTNTQIRKIRIFYKNLPVEIDNKRQKIVKKKWPLGDLSKLQKIFLKKLKKKIGNCKIDNPKTKEGYKSFGLFQESFPGISQNFYNPPLFLDYLFYNFLFFFLIFLKIFFAVWTNLLTAIFFLLFFVFYYQFQQVNSCKIFLSF